MTERYDLQASVEMIEHLLVEAQATAHDAEELRKIISSIALITLGIGNSFRKTYLKLKAGEQFLFHMRDGELDSHKNVLRYGYLLKHTVDHKAINPNMVFSSIVIISQHLRKLMATLDSPSLASIEHVRSFVDVALRRRDLEALTSH